VPWSSRTGAAQRALRELEGTWRSQLISVAIVAATTGTAFLAGFIGGDNLSSSQSAVLAVLIIMSAAVALWIGPYVVAPRVNWPSWKARLLEAGLCPSCTYTLPGAAEADKCHVCPECGAAWVLPAADG
jgi:hypothetical protein